MKSHCSFNFQFSNGNGDYPVSKCSLVFICYFVRLLSVYNFSPVLDWVVCFLVAMIWLNVPKGPCLTPDLQL